MCYVYKRVKAEGWGIKISLPSGVVNVMDFSVKCDVTSLDIKSLSLPQG
jgi:hypothetical protein